MSAMAGVGHCLPGRLKANEWMNHINQNLCCAMLSSYARLLVQQAKRQHRKVHKSSVMRLAGVGLARLVAEEDKVVLYHCLANNHEQHASGRGYCDGKDQARAFRCVSRQDS